MLMKNFTLMTAVVLGALTAAPAAWSQDWPTQPITLIVPFPPGGVADSIPRMLQGRLQEALGQPVIVENRVGGATMVAMDAVAKSTDNHTFGLLTIQSLGLPAAGATTPYDTREDLTGITMLGSTASVLVVPKDMPINSVPELLAYAKEHPGEMMAPSGGNASGAHFAIENLNIGAGLDIEHVAYRGTAPAYVDLLAGRMNMMFAAYGSARQYWESGDLRPLAVTTPERFSFMPDLPTMREVSGIPDFTLVEWYGLVGSSKMPEDAREKFNAALTEIMQTPAYAEFNQRLGLEYTPMTAAETHTYLMSELDRLSTIADQAGIQIEE